MPRNQERGDVYVWVIRITGQVQELTVRADRGLARDWVESELGEEGTWQHAEHLDRYDLGTETAFVRCVDVPDADALISVDDLSA
jgi:hypothetical protein